MEDLRDAERAVSEFCRLIDKLRPDNNSPSPTAERPDLLSKRNDSESSHKSTKSAISARWRSKSSKKEWDESVEGSLWNELEQSLNRVAFKFNIGWTALKEYISSPEMMDLGSEFVRHYYGSLESEKAYWVAEDLFFDLQAVKQGDIDPGRWAEAKVYKKDWDLADHLIRFVLLADQCRVCSGQEKWIAWQWSFAINISFYLNVLRCYTSREAKQRELARASSGSSSQSQEKRRSKHDPLSPAPRVWEKGPGRKDGGGKEGNSCGSVIAIDY
ncbi:hypothetical protein NUW58_g4025 [Xylaria curta]|uniref:Uncharacterized protein n=1 Tax=Xylaria curta TaxID=42375 RepID=A0ACC1P8P3_9PEZI|nr:hypothetical protein NUW58_g4025 [Xylaria curta]